MATRVTVAPRILDFEHKVPSVNQWLIAVNERMVMKSGTANPTTSEIPENQWILYHNTTLGEVRIWTNIGGVLKSSAAFT